MECLDALIAFLRAYGVIAPDEHLPAFPRKAGTRAVHRIAMKWLDRGQAPDPGFIPPDGLRLVRTVAELRELGRRLKNCINQPVFGGRYLIDLVTGAQCYLTTEEPALTLIALHPHGRNLWSIEQIDGADFCSIRDRLELGLRWASVTLLHSRPDSALSSLTDYSEVYEEGAEEADDDELAA